MALIGVGFKFYKFILLWLESMIFYFIFLEFGRIWVATNFEDGVLKVQDFPFNFILNLS